MATPAGGIVVDLALESAAFRREWAKAQRQLHSETQKMRKSMQTVERSSRNLAKSFQGLKVGLAGIASALAVRQFGRFANDALKAGATIQDTANKIGFATSSLQQLRFAAVQSGVNVRTLDMAMQRFSRRIGEVAQGQGELLKTAQQYNVAIKNQDGTTRDNIEILKDFADVIKNATSEQERLRIAFKLFDSEGAAFVVALKNGAAGLEDLMEQARAFGAVMSDEVVAKAKLADDNLTSLAMVFKSTFNTAIIEGFADSLTLTEDRLRSAQKTGESFGAAVGAAMRGVVTVAQFVADNMNEISAAIATLVAYKSALVFGGIATAAWKLVDALRAASVGMLALNAAMVSNPIGLASVAVGALVGGLVLLHAASQDAKNSTVDYNDAIESTNTAMDGNLVLSAQFRQARIDEAIATNEAAIATENLARARAVEIKERLESRRRNQYDQGTLGRALGGTGTKGLSGESLDKNIQAAAARVAAYSDNIKDLNENIARLREESKKTAGATVASGTALAPVSAAAKKLAEDYKKLIDRMTLSRDGAKKLAEAHKKGAAEVKRVNAEIKIANLQLARGAVFTAEQKIELYQLIRAEQEYREEIEKTTQATKDREAAAKKAAEELKRQAEEARKLALEPFKNAIEGIQSAFSSAFESIFNGGVDSFSDLASTVKRIFIRLAAEIATLLVFKPVVAGVLGSVGLGGVASMLTGGGGGGVGISDVLGIGKSLIGDGLDGILSWNGVGLGGILSQPIGLTLAGETLATIGPSAAIGPAVSPAAGLGGASLGSILGVAGLGFAGGGLLASLTGGNQLGGSVGGGFGAGIGFAVGGPVGAAIGGIGGSLLGGLFGGGESVGPNAGALIQNRAGGLVLGPVGADNGGDASGVAAIARQVISTLNNLAKEFNLKIVSPLGQQSSITTGAQFGGFQSGEAFVNALFAKGGVTSSDSAQQKIIDQSSSLAEALQRLTKYTNDLAAAERESLSRSIKGSATIVDFLRGQSLSAGSSLSPTDRLQEAQRQFADLAKRVRGGDASLAGNLTASAQTLLGFGRQQFASSVDFANLEGFVRSNLLNISEDLLSDSFIDRQTDALIEAQRQATESATEDSTAVIAAIRELRRELRLLRLQEAA